MTAREGREDGLMFEPGQKFRFENEGHKPRSFVLLDPTSKDDMSKAEQSMLGASGGGDVAYLRNTKTGGIASIYRDWLANAYAPNPGTWVAVTK